MPVPYAQAGVEKTLATATCPVESCGEVFYGTTSKKATAEYARHYTSAHAGWTTAVPPKRAEGVVVTLDRVEVTQDPAAPREWVVRAYWNGVDRPEGVGVVATNRVLAERLKRAIEAGVVYTDLHALYDVNGNTFASHRSHVLARMLNADLRRLGF